MNVSASVTDHNEYENNQIDSPMPEGLKSFSFHLLMMPIAPRIKSAGGIIMPQQRQDGEEFMNNIARIVSIGPAAFRGAWWRDRGYIRTDKGEDAPTFSDDSLRIPQPGDMVRMSGVRNRSFWFKKVKIYEIDDTQIRSIVDPKEAYEYRFWN